MVTLNGLVAGAVRLGITEIFFVVRYKQNPKSISYVFIEFGGNEFLEVLCDIYRFSVVYRSTTVADGASYTRFTQYTIQDRIVFK